MKIIKYSDYAINKYSEGIKYKFADCIVEITLPIVKDWKKKGRNYYCLTFY